MREVESHSELIRLQSCEFAQDRRIIFGVCLAEYTLQMTLPEYQKLLSEIGFGKRLPGALYVFFDESSDFGAPINKMLVLLKHVYCVGQEFNIVKFRTEELKISFLSYPDFFDDPHPALFKAVTIDLVKGKARETDYRKNANPPILHRKETFLPSGHPSRSEFAVLTKAEEAFGLYTDTATIGFRLNWEHLLKSNGLEFEGHRLLKINPEKSARENRVVVVDRHKTALTRYELSKPVKTLLEYGLIKSTSTFFDYGCGPGSDIRGLQSLGFDSDGWDPVYRPQGVKRESEIINLGYVLNVIEQPAERLATLVEAYRLTKRLLVVSALITETVPAERATPYGDGILTRRNTFQKYFDQQELQQYIEDALEATAVPVAIGVYYVFRDPVEQQDFLSARSRRTIDWMQISSRLGLGAPARDQWIFLYNQHKTLLDAFGQRALDLGRIPTNTEFEGLDKVQENLGSIKRALRAFVQGGDQNLDWNEISKRFNISAPAKSRSEILYEEHKDLLDAFWTTALQFGRLPSPDEFPRFNELCNALGSAKKAWRIFVQRGGGEEMKSASDARRNDLLVYVGLANLRKRIPFGHLSASLRLDIRTFFGNYKRALEKGLELLYAAGDAGEIELACEELKLGWQDEQALYVHRSLLSELPALLRAYVGCATALFGDAGQADVIKLHKSSGKVTFLVHEDFENVPTPKLLQRIKVNLRTRWVQVFDHVADNQLLDSKEKFLIGGKPL